MTLFMSIGTDENLPKIVLDTNILISAVGFKGKPREVLELVLNDKIKAFSSSVLLAELEDVISKKFPVLAYNESFILAEIRDKLYIVAPQSSIHAVRDWDDNRVLEAAVEGDCDYIVTGDRDLLDLNSYKKIKIVTAEQFLNKYFVG